jgi:hypothetical protein
MTKIVTGDEFEIESVGAKLEDSKLTLNYDLFIKGYDVFATVETTLDSYAAEDYYAPDRDGFDDRRFMNDTPKITISSVDCLDNQGDFCIETHVKIMKLVMTDYHERKMQHIWKYEALSAKQS